MKCGACGNGNAYVMRFTSCGECCDACGGIRSSGVPDVYFRGPYFDPNLGHPKRGWEKDGVWVESKRHKQRLMAEQGLKEVGGKVHGARNFDRKRVERLPGVII